MLISILEFVFLPATSQARKYLSFWIMGQPQQWRRIILFAVIQSSKTNQSYQGSTIIDDNTNMSEIESWQLIPWTGTGPEDYSF